ncbi:MAG TPA: hypothetical protein VI916_09290 [Acidimicrobiia bacterium]|nr:hypothetical protein [Acidimicrobiia bacterium]
MADPTPVTTSGIDGPSRLRVLRMILVVVAIMAAVIMGLGTRAPYPLNSSAAHAAGNPCSGNGGNGNPSGDDPGAGNDQGQGSGKTNPGQGDPCDDAPGGGNDDNGGGNDDNGGSSSSDDPPPAPTTTTTAPQVPTISPAEAPIEPAAPVTTPTTVAAEPPVVLGVVVTPPPPKTSTPTSVEVLGELARTGIDGGLFAGLGSLALALSWGIRRLVRAASPGRAPR